jgi:hypothetical protein
MWLVFQYILAKFKVIGTLYVVPFATIEAFILLVLLSKRHARPRAAASE